MQLFLVILFTNKGDTAKTGKKKKKQKNNCGDNGNDEDDVSDSEAADKKDNEADEIEKLLIGLKENSDDQLFSVGSIPLAGCQREPIIVPDSNPAPTFRKFYGTTGHDALQRRGRHNIRKLVSKLQEETKTAAILESERRERVKNERLKVCQIKKNFVFISNILHLLMKFNLFNRFLLNILFPTCS